LKVKNIFCTFVTITITQHPSPITHHPTPNTQHPNMAKDKIAYVCSNCGQESAKWIGKCPACGHWNTFKEIRIANESGSMAARSAASTVRQSKTDNRNHPMRLSEISSRDLPRIDMHDGELNRVLGGGLVPGSIVLLGGEPGIGKSTLSLQTALTLTDKKILYVSGEESLYQLKMRAERITQHPTLRPPSHSLRNIVGGHLQPHQGSGARTGGDRLHTNHQHRRGGQLARQHHPGARVRRCPTPLCQV
jgi:hypothetical protein